jgi:hypothetical protein
MTAPHSRSSRSGQPHPEDAEQQPPSHGQLPYPWPTAPEGSYQRQPQYELPYQEPPHLEQPYQQQAHVDDPYQQAHRDQPYQPPNFDQSYQPPRLDQPYQPPNLDQPYQPPRLDQPYQPPRLDQPYQPPNLGQPYQQENRSQSSGRHAAVERPPAHLRGAPASRRPRFGAFAWSALVLGIVGVAGSQILVANLLPVAVVAGVGAVLGVIALFGTRKLPAGVGVVLSVGAIVVTVLAQGAAVAEPDSTTGGLAGDEAAAMRDVTIRDCVVADRGPGILMAEATIEIANGTDQRQSYMVTVTVDDSTGARVAEINAIATSLPPGQSVVLSGQDASGSATEQARPGPADCQVASVNRLALGG